ncbi:hypothetical protein [Martelella alba]|uniref:hypothetical protein n=1 Tax=Martelella alba TaxID=2590451 RepID=UPI001E34247F|nr:hypothetical protein [Martelella alba]
MVNKVAVVVTMILVLMFGVLTWAAFHYYGKYTAEATTNATLTQENKSAALVVANQEKLVNIFNTIAGATLNEQAKNTATSQDRQTVIKTVIQTESCAVITVPAAAADVLLDHYNAIRQNAGDADTSQSDATVSSQRAAK